jgi:lipopolysaccharide transport system permease protein
MEFEIRPTHRFNLKLKELWSFRELIYFFTWRDLKIKYKQTVLGALWVLLQPFILMVVFTLFIARAVQIPTGNLPYPVFVFAGLMLWNIFSNGMSSAGNSMLNNAHIIKKIYFPRLIIPVSSVIGTLVDFLTTFVMFVGLLFFYSIHIHIILLLIALPISILITVLTTFGMGSGLAALNVKYRDFRYIIPFMVQVLMFLTPVIYPVSMINIPWLRGILELNPMAAAIDILRGSFTGEMPETYIVVRGLLVSLIIAIAGLGYFRKTEHYFADLA